jgi:hypothetical protein
MPKQTLQDVMPPRRSIRQVVFPRGADREGQTSRAQNRKNGGSYSGGNIPRRIPPTPSSSGGEPSRRGLWVLAGISVLLLYLTFALFFSGAKITVTPRQEQVVLDGRFSAVKEAQPLGLQYETMSLSEEETRKLQATGEKQVETKASGTIIVYNNFNSSPQRLIKNTRFMSPDGLIYRIPSSIVVPGQKTVNGKVVPGSVEAVVYADSPGEEYNKDELVDFTIPGFKGGPRYSAFYARSKTPMTGGFAGVVKTVSPAEENAAREEIRTALSEQLKKKARQQIPKGFILYDDAVFIDTDSLPNTEDTNSGKVIIGERVTLHGVLFNEEALSAFIARNTIAHFEESSVIVSNLNELTFKIVDKTEARPWKEERLSFTLVGTPYIIWTFDETRLKNDLAGKSKQQINTILSGYPGIEKAEVVIRPFWKKSFPKNINKIKIETIINKSSG